MGKVHQATNGIKNHRVSLSPLFTWRSAITESELPPTARHVALTLSLHMNERGGSCWPSREQLAAETGYVVETISRAVAVLESDNWLEVDRPEVPGRGRANRYTATVPGYPSQDHLSANAERVIGDPSASDTPHRITLGRQEDVSTSGTEKEIDTGSTHLQTRAFEDFWRIYPARNGKKLDRKKAETAWNRLTDLERTKAVTAVLHYAASCGNYAKDGFRWLRDKSFNDWQTPATNGSAKRFEPKGNAVVRKILASVEAENGASRVRGALEFANPSLPDQ